jgi:Beta-lactamase superfamily domain
MEDQVCLLNHASVLIRTDDVAVLSDPWFSGKAFNNGWNLVYHNTPAQIEAVLGTVSHIYISHEHPDHFSMDFFKEHAQTLIDRGVSVIFQETRDGRVAGFLRNKLKLDVIEIPHSQWCDIGQSTRILVEPSGAIDSALILESRDFTYVNINDCEFVASELKTIAGYLTPEKPVVLFNQFSYAAWRKDKAWLQKAATYKLRSLRRSVDVLKADLTIPFASFSYFCHPMNFWMNECVNTPETVSANLANDDLAHCFLCPEQAEIPVSRLISDAGSRVATSTEAIAFWKRAFEQIECDSPDVGHEVSRDLPDPALFFERIREANSMVLLRLIRLLTFGMVFGNVSIYLQERQEAYRLSFDELAKMPASVDEADCDISMGIESFRFMIEQAFGFDTLTVNGLFSEPRPQGFRNLTFSLGFITLNQAGYGIKLKDIFVGRIFYRLLMLPVRIIQRDS